MSGEIDSSKLAYVGGLLDEVPVEQNSIIYLAGPYTAKDPYDVHLNIGKLYCYFALLSRRYTVICLPLSTAGFDQTALHKDIQHRDWMLRCLGLIACSDALVCVPGWENSNGSIQEINFALNSEINIPVFAAGPLGGDARKRLYSDFCSDYSLYPLRQAGLAYLTRTARPVMPH